MIKSKKLSKMKNLKHGFFNMRGGISKNIYKSLNCGPGSGDKERNVKKMGIKMGHILQSILGLWKKDLVVKKKIKK